MSQYPQPQQPYPQPPQQPYQQPPAGWVPQQQQPYPAQPPQQYPPPQGPAGWAPQQQQPGYMPPPRGQAGGSLFSGVNTAKPRNKSEYIKSGHYLVRVDCCKLDRTRKHEDFAAVEMTVVKVFDNLNGHGHTLGASVTFIQKRSSDYFLQEINAFISAATGIPNEQVDEGKCMEIFGAGNPLQNTVLELVANTIMTQANKPFTKINFRRALSASEVKQQLANDPHSLSAFFPNGILDRLEQIEAQYGGPQHPAAPQGQPPAPAPYQQPQPQYAPPPAQGYYPPQQQPPAAGQLPPPSGGYPPGYAAPAAWQPPARQ